MNSRPFGPIAIACLFSSLAITPLIQASSAIAQTQNQFADASNHWAAPFITGLSQRNIINGFPDGSFRPDDLVTRAQFATIVQQAFNTPNVRATRAFNDVGSGYWAAQAIQQSYSEGFLSGYTDGSFQPDQPIPKVQALVAIASGLNLQSVGSIDNTLLRFYDAREIPNYAKGSIAAATERNIPVNYPNASVLNPNQAATRADVAAFIYQTLVSQGRVTPVGTNFPAAQYVVQGGGLAANTAATGTGSLPLGTEIPVELSGAEPGAKLVMAVGENAESALKVSRDVVDSNQQVVIPQGSVIMGRFQPFQVEKTEGTQFEATKLMIGNTPYTIHASSIPIAARKRSSFKVGDLAGSVTTLGTSILVDRLLADDGEDLNVASLVPGIIQTGRAVGSSVLNSSKTSDKLILVEPNNMGLKLNSVFEFLPASATAFSETALSNPNQVDVGTLVTLSAASPDSKYVLVPDESMDLELKTARAIFNRQGQVLIPEGSIIKGRVEPTEINGNEGAQFIANTLILGTQSYSINAASPSITAVSMKSLNAADFHGNVIASPGASETIRGVGGASQSTSGGGFLGIGNLLGGSGSKKKIILLNPNTLQLEFTAPLTVNNFGS